MRRIVFTATGDPSVLHEIDVPIPEPGPREVRVRIHRSGVNPTDWKSRRGSEPGTPVVPAQTPNQDGAGVVDALGPGVEPSLLGARVWIWEAAKEREWGTAADYSLIPARQVVGLPDVASYDVGAALAIPFMTAHRCLTVHEGGPARLAHGALQGQTVLVAGGAGAVGNAAIQLARWAGATIIATVSSPAKARLATAAGADHTINYRDEDVVAAVRKITPGGVDTIVEVAAATNAGIDSQVLALHGSVAVYAGTGGDAATIPIRAAMTPNARWQFVLVYSEPAAAKAQAVEDIQAAVLDGAVRTGEEAGLPIHHFPLADTAAAHVAVEQGVTGKVLIDVAD
jgi:NADPH2:quinone reductase